MSTNLQIITDALRGIGVISEIQTPSSEQGAAALRTLNQMMEQWEVAEGIKLGWFNQTSTTATIPVPSWAEMAVMSSLGLRLAPIYGASVSPEFGAVGSDAYQALLRVVTNANLQPVDMSHLPLGILGGEFDINNG